MTDGSAAITGHPWGSGIVSIARDTQPCHFCHGDTAIRVHGRAAHGGCWEEAGKPSPSATSAPDTPADAPAPNPSTTDAPPQSPARPKAYDSNEELDDFARALTRVRGNTAEVSREFAAAALEEWHNALTVEDDPVHFHSNPGRTGIVLHSWLVKRYGSMEEPEALESQGVWDISRSRQMVRIVSWVNPDAAPTTGQHVTETDVHAQFLAAAHSVQLGDGEPTDILDGNALAAEDQLALVKSKCPGYVQLASAPNVDGLASHVRGAFAQLQAGWWLPMPLAAYLIQTHQVELDLEAAILWRTRPGKSKGIRAHGPRLSRWAKTLVSGRERLLQRANPETSTNPEAAAAALSVLKAVYTTFLGGLLRSEEHNDTDTLRPDWCDQVMALSQANMLRALDKVHAAGYDALGGNRDSAWWLGDTAPIQPEGLTFSEQAGKWRVTRHGAVDQDIIAAHATGSAAKLRKAITAAHRARTGDED